ncbi:type II secretion system F family protein [Granulicella tundricola]|uniref:Type II secretion system F domain protein n=1 Tax=Granulicella tundricola (strain ATCC BAA-1859 / DSM 23138 / MP5ACTX9) TaxID=1198114 RepID=E8WY00_GRATM|nr:type II secretion system F family protein [Granulicella tundricola]ADW67539.1 Type II secretion system F domain protein [Granulicella tundricola MP5ACTX9]
MLVTIFIGALILSFGLVLFLLRPDDAEKALERKLRVISSDARKEQAETEGYALTVKKAEGILFEIGEMVERYHFSQDLQQLILHSGTETTVGSVIGISAVLAVAAALLAHIFLGIYIVDAVAFVVGGSARWMQLKWKKSSRLGKFEEALPDAIDLMARALRAGHAMSSAIEVVAEESAEPLAGEFAIVFQQQKFGLQFRDALLQLGDRVPSKDLSFLITAILVQKETGGDLTDVLDRTTRVIRERIRIQGEIRTYTAQGRLTGWILSALPVVMLCLINVATPGYSHILFHDPTGQLLLGAGGVLILIGGFIISRVVDIKV